MTIDHELAVAGALDRIEARNPSLNAMSRVLRDEALVAVRASTSSGPLAGVPISVKSNVDVAGSATDQGVVALADAIPSTDAPLVALQHFAVQGPMATSLSLLRTAFHAMAGPHPDDPWSSVGAVPRQRTGAWRVGVLAVPGDESVAEVVEISRITLSEAGHEVASIDELSVVQGAEAWLSLLSHDVGTFTLPM